MTHLHVKVTEKTAYYTGPMPVCGNSDYMVEWELDQEWDDRQSKTMRVVFPDGRYQDTLFSGTSVALPAVPGGYLWACMPRDFRHGPQRSACWHLL